MTKTDWLSQLSLEPKTRAGNQQAWNERIGSQRVAGSVGVAVLLLMSCVAAAQAPQAPADAVQNGYTVHQTADLGGHIANVSGSGAMYDTLVNIHSGPRVLGETFEMHAVPGTKHSVFDSLSALSGGFGGDPANFAKLTMEKGKLYEFTGTFRRDRQYFDYDLLGNPLIPPGQTIGIGASASLGTYAWPQLNDSPILFNTVRRMTDTNLTLLPLSKVTFRIAYSKNIFQGPTISPSRSVGKTDFLTVENQRNSTDDFIGGVDWKPWTHTKFTFEEQITHYKADSNFVLDPATLNVREANGLPVALGNWDSKTAYPASDCNANSMATAGVVLIRASGSAGLPVVDAACDVYSSYLRSQPTRILTPTETIRFQSDSIKNIATNGVVRYTNANSNLPNYYENFQGLDGTVRNATFTGHASAEREEVGADYGITWEATKSIELSDQFDYSNQHQPGTADITAGIGLNTPSTAGNETINYSGALVSGTNLSTTGITTGTGGVGIPLPAYFGQKFLTNNATATWEGMSNATFSLTYRYRTHSISQTSGTGAAQNVITIHENGGIFNAGLRPSNHWDLSGTVEIAYADNVLTPVAPRQTQHYRFHTMYKPKTWITVSGAYNDLERHNNTNNTGTASVDGPLNHVDHSRVAGMGLVLAPNEHYGFDLNYDYSDVYAATNSCFLSGATATIPGVDTGVACPDKSGDWLGRDFMDAPTQDVSFALMLSPVKTFHSSIGYRISAVNGSQSFNDAQAVNGSLVSAYQSPYLNIAWTIHPGWIWRAEYNYYGYGEGGMSGAAMCSSAPPVSGVGVTTVLPVAFPCSFAPVGSTGMTESPAGLSAPRNFHASNITLVMHYEF